MSFEYQCVYTYQKVKNKQNALKYRDIHEWQNPNQNEIDFSFKIKICKTKLISRKWDSICTKSKSKVLIQIKYFCSRYQNQLNEISQCTHNVTINQCIYVKLYVTFCTFYICV